MNKKLCMVLSISVLMCFVAAMLSAQENMPNRGMRPPMGGGGVAITSDGTFVYVIMGPNLYKLNCANLEVLKTATLPRPQNAERPPMENENLEGRRSSQKK